MANTTAKREVERVALPADEFAATCGKSRFWVYRMIRQNKLKVIRGYGSLLIPAAELDRLLAAAE